MVTLHFTFLWKAAKFDIVTSVIQLEELRRASRYPKFKAVLQPARVGTMINNLQHAIIVDRFMETPLKPFLARE